MIHSLIMLIPTGCHSGVCRQLLSQQVLAFQSPYPPSLPGHGLAHRVARARTLRIAREGSLSLQVLSKAGLHHIYYSPIGQTSHIATGDPQRLPKRKNIGGLVLIRSHDCIPFPEDFRHHSHSFSRFTVLMIQSARHGDTCL